MIDQAKVNETLTKLVGYSAKESIMMILKERVESTVSFDINRLSTKSAMLPFSVDFGEHGVSSGVLFFNSRYFRIPELMDLNITEVSLESVRTTVRQFGTNTKYMFDGKLYSIFESAVIHYIKKFKPEAIGWGPTIYKSIQNYHSKMRNLDSLFQGKYVEKSTKYGNGFLDLLVRNDMVDQIATESKKKQIKNPLNEIFGFGTSNHTKVQNELKKMLNPAKLRNVFQFHEIRKQLNQLRKAYPTELESIARDYGTTADGFEDKVYQIWQDANRNYQS